MPMSLGAHLQVQQEIVPKGSPSGKDTHAGRMMMVYLMYGLRANPNARIPSHLRKILSGEVQG